MNVMKVIWAFLIMDGLRTAATLYIDYRIYRYGFGTYRGDKKMVIADEFDL